MSPRSGRRWVYRTVGGLNSNLLLRGTSIRRGMGFPPQTEALKKFFDDRTLLDNDVPILENVYLEEVAGKRRAVFCFPIETRRTDGAPTRVDSA